MVAAVGLVGAVLAGAGPAHAVAINNLVFEGPAFVGAGPGGSISQAQIDAIVAANEVKLGLLPGTIDLIGQINLGLTATFTQAAGSNFTSSMFLGVTGCTVSDCTGAFQVNFDFAGLDKDWQIVKIAELGGPAQWAKGVWVTDTLQIGPLSDLQSGSVSLQEWLDYTASAKTVSGCSGPQPPGGCNHDLGNPIWHMLVFGVGTQTSVPEPGTLMLLGLGLIGAGAAARKKTQK
jgi:hypothetical protein